jgi:CPA2 family monovalent cation:H+ antiporter-2
MHSFDLLLTLTGGLGAALAGGYVTHRLGLSPIVGYLFAGVLVGPYTPGFVADQHLAEQMAEIGVILLMFGVGLQFHLDELLAVRRIAIPGALGQSAVATVMGTLVAHGFGWDWNGGLVFGMALAVASTVVLVRVLSDNRDLHTPTGHIAVGWLVVEDPLTVLILVLMPALFGPERESGVLTAVSVALMKVGVLAAFTMLAGGRVIPWALNHVAATGSRELFTLSVLVIALGVAVGSARLFDVSMALGAFMAGMVVGRSEFSVRAASEALPMRDAFAVLFFVSVGMLLDPGHLLRAPSLVALTVGVVMIGKPLVALAIVLLFGYPLRVALGVAVALAQIGEFSFILANLGTDLGMLTREATNTLIAAAIVSITANPLLYRVIDRVDLWAARRSRPEVVADAAPRTQILDRAVVVGYGPVGRTVTRLLRENQVDPTIVELNMDTVRVLRSEGIPAVYGDARHLETLTNAGIATARGLIITVAGMTAVEETIRLARQANPSLQILVRTAYLRERDALRQAGATTVFSGEGEVALALTESVLQRLGATPEQIDRERARVHAELS